MNLPATAKARVEGSRASWKSWTKGKARDRARVGKMTKLTSTPHPTPSNVPRIQVLPSRLFRRDLTLLSGDTNPQGHRADNSAIITPRMNKGRDYSSGRFITVNCAVRRCLNPEIKLIEDSCRDLKTGFQVRIVSPMIIIFPFESGRRNRVMIRCHNSCARRRHMLSLGALGPQCANLE